MRMSKCRTVEIKQMTSSEVDNLTCLGPSKNYGAMLRLNQQFGEIIRYCGVQHLVFKLGIITASAEGITDTGKTSPYTEEDKASMETLFYRDRKHTGEASTNMKDNKRPVRLSRSNQFVTSFMEQRDFSY
jgi:hypothetical protein